jgi:aminobenzoyl-glutamate utilization protein B
MAKLVFPSNVPNISFHHWAAGAALATSIAHKGALAGAKVLACSLIECFTNPAVVEQARQSFARETQDTPYYSLLPADQKPPVHLNEKAMSAWRPAMKAHYLRERPRFS